VKHEVIILDDDNYDLDDDLEPEYDVEELRRQTQAANGQLRNF